MKLFLSFLLYIYLIGSVHVEAYSDVCYGDLGCFTTRPPFSTSLARPIAVLPDAPEIVDTRFYLYTRDNAQFSTVDYDVPNPLFNAQRETKFIVHGFLHNGFKNWVLDIKNALLRAGDYNVIVVDWSKANGFPYTKATANSQLVGAQIAKLIRSLVGLHKLNPQSVHIIGHSLGAHIAGYAGEKTPNLGRITGLDPAGPYFENTDPVVRLDKTDASFVDVIHTDGAATLKLGLGLMQMSGHVDFYPNGGLNQPNCPGASMKLLTAIFNAATINLDAIDENLGCSHMSAVYFFKDSIENNECKYVSYPCNTLDDFNEGSCLKCSVYGCNKMGFWAQPNHDTGRLYLNTQDADRLPYCQHHYHIKLNSNQLTGQTQARGTFKIVLEGDTTSSLPLLLDDSDETFKAGASYIKLSPSTKYVGEAIKSATVSYTKTTTFLSSWLYQDQWSFKSIEVTYGDNQNYVKLCPSATYIQSGSSLKFNKC